MPGGELPQDDIEEVLVWAWRLLARGAIDQRNGFHTLSAATIGLDGRPRSRTVVLRWADSLTSTLRFHCDRRTDKCAELSADPRIALLGYDAHAGVQLRIEGVAKLHTDDAVAEDAWSRTPRSNRANYGTLPAPGAIIRTSADYSLAAAGEDGGRNEFCAILVKVESLELLHLARKGHRRARFRWEGARVEATWLVP